MFPSTRQTLPEIPRYFSAADTGFDRYFAHNKFTELGFTPYNPNTEAIYNSNSGLTDDMERMRGEFSGLFGNAFMSGYRAIGDLFTGEYRILTLKEQWLLKMLCELVTQLEMV